MNHQPYERWILEPQELSREQRGELEDHISVCADCRRMQEAWLETEMALKARVEIAPRPGFSRRWQASINERRLRDQRRQGWRVFLACSGAAALLSILFIAYVASSTSPVEWIQAGVRVVASSVGMVGALRDVTATWLQYTPSVFSVAIWISVAVTFCVIIFIWVFAMWRTSLGGAVQR
jgi:anti-sigma factor RsiW